MSCIVSPRYVLSTDSSYTVHCAGVLRRLYRVLSDTPSLSSRRRRSAWLRAVYEALRAVVVGTTICGGVPLSVYLYL